LFRFQSGESADAASRKQRRRREARQHWPFLTELDLSAVGDEHQLAAMIASRAGIPEAQARRHVQAWLQPDQL
jgi:hypothetical protein